MRNLIVTESVNGYVLSLKLYLTYGTVDYGVVVTVVYTIGINVVLYNGGAFGMTECGLLIVGGVVTS